MLSFGEVVMNLAKINKSAYLARLKRATEDKTDKRPEVRFPIGFCKPGCKVPLFMGSVHEGPCRNE